MAAARGYGLLIPLSMIWGGAFVAIREADFELSSVNLTLLRWFIVCAAFLVLYPFIVKPRVKLERRDIPRFLVVGAFNVAIYHLSLNYSEKTVDASLAGLLISLAPLFGVVLSAIFLQEKVGRRVFLALALGLTGTFVIFVPDLNLGITTLLGPLAVVLSSFASGAYTVASKPLVTKYGPIPVSVWASLIGTALLLPLVSPSLLQQAVSLSFYGWASVLYLALLSTVLANTIYFTLVGLHPVSKLSVQLYLVPLVSVTGGIVLLGESLSAFTIAGGVVLILAVTLVTWRRH
jgi:drug/metabolite transporter (DMT)-like permease